MELEKLHNQIHIFEKAYKTLEKGLEKQNLSDLEKDGIIQRFEYTIELSWKTLKKLLNYKKVNFLATPKDIFRECYKIGIITDLELWEDFLDIRNISSHIYSEYVSNQSFLFISENHKKIGMLITNLKNLEIF